MVNKRRRSAPGADFFRPSKRAANEANAWGMAMYSQTKNEVENMSGKTKEPVNNERQMRNLKPSFLKWDEVGETVAGRIHTRGFVQMKNGSSPKYTVDSDEQGLVSFLAPLQVAEALDTVPLGTYIEITYTGQTKTPGGHMKEFDIMAEDHVPRITVTTADGENVDVETGEIG